jgi:hypothetical protein
LLQDLRLHGALSQGQRWLGRGAMSQETDRRGGGTFLCIVSNCLSTLGEHLTLVLGIPFPNVRQPRKTLSS